jgi:hypothetical protein
MIYVTSYFAQDDPGEPSGATRKIEDLGDHGSVVWVNCGNAAWFSGPIIDRNHIYSTALGRWSSANDQYEAIRKDNGGTFYTANADFNSIGWSGGITECTENVYDLLYVANDNWQIMAMNTEAGDFEFGYNCTQTGSNRGAGMAMNSKYVLAARNDGSIYCFGNGDTPRPRMHILLTDELQAVPFNPSPGDPYEVDVTFDDVFLNNGCANLTGTITASDAAPALVVTSVNPHRIGRLSNLADNMVTNSYETMVKAVTAYEEEETFDETAYSKDSYSNKSAYAAPAWLLGFNGTDAFDLAEGETHSVSYHVDGNLVFRGPQRCWLTISSNDDYYINSADDPVIQLGCLGGCLEAWTTMPFGVTEQNIAPVINNGEHGNQTPADLFEFDGDHASYWQGGEIIGVEQYRIAFSLESWHSGDPVDYWNTLLADELWPGQCDPVVSTEPLLLGQMLNEGTGLYEDVMGYVAQYAYIDSIINYDCHGTGWDWTNTDCDFDNALTMGLRFDQWMYGVVGVAEFNNVLLYRTKVTNRNAAALPGVSFMILTDFDLEYNATDVYFYDDVNVIMYASSCKNVDPNDTRVYGYGKINHAADPMIGCRTLDADQAMWHADNIALDSMYDWSVDPANDGIATYQLGVDYGFPCVVESSDREVATFLGTHDFAPSEVYEYGYYMHGNPAGDVQDAAYYAELAVLMNQFAGFGRGDINNDGVINLTDIVALWNLVDGTGDGPLFQHLVDVNASGGVPDAGDVQYLADYWFNVGPAPIGDWVLPTVIP